MRKWRMRRNQDESLFSWKDSAMQRFADLCLGEMQRFGYFNRATYANLMEVIEESIAQHFITTSARRGNKGRKGKQTT